MDTSIEPSPPAALPAPEPVARVVLKRARHDRFSADIRGCSTRQSIASTDPRPMAMWSTSSRTKAISLPEACTTAKAAFASGFTPWKAGEALDESFWRARLQAAAGLRAQHGFDDRSQAARLVSSEGDRLSVFVESVMPTNSWCK